jgi:hypothetical protein
VVSAALVAEREAEDKEIATVEPQTNKPKSLPARLGADNPSLAQTDETEQQVVKKMLRRPVYFVSSLLQGARSRYSGVQKLLFGLLMASRKLHHYFQAH